MSGKEMMSTLVELVQISDTLLYITPFYWPEVEKTDELYDDVYISGHFEPVRCEVFRSLYIKLVWTIVYLSCFIQGH